MRGERLVLDDIIYVKAENGKGFERIFSINIEENQKFRVQQMISFIKAGILPDSMLIMPIKIRKISCAYRKKQYFCNNYNNININYYGDF